jgi:hypothetical protein
MWGWVRLDDRLGLVRQGNVRSGLVTSGQVRYGEVRPGYVVLSVSQRSAMSSPAEPAPITSARNDHIGLRWSRCLAPFTSACAELTGLSRPQRLPPITSACADHTSLCRSHRLAAITSCADNIGLRRPRCLASISSAGFGDVLAPISSDGAEITSVDVNQVCTFPIISAPNADS